jgi:hypothetical protein
LAKAQAMFEFMLVVTVMMIILIFAVMVKQQRLTQVDEIETDSEAKHLCDIFSSSVNMVYAGGKGSGMNLTVPDKLGSTDFNATISSDKLLVLSYGGKNLFCSFIAPVSNSTSDSFPLKKGTITISNLGEAVTVT